MTTEPRPNHLLAALPARCMKAWYALAGHRRTAQANRWLGALLAGVAGAINAGGFLAVQRYTSHMTGIVSSVADHVALGHTTLALAGLAALASFTAGAACTAILVNWGRRRRLHGKYAVALMAEAALLLLFGIAGANLQSFAALLLPSTVLLLCFIMGLQNAVTTKISPAGVRSTHVTGIVTDIGIELGRLLYWNRDAAANGVHRVGVRREKLATHLAVLGMFLSGGVAGAFAFATVGFKATLPIAVGLALLALPPIVADLRRLGSRRRRRARRLASVR